VARYTCERREDDVPIERVVPEVKDFVREATLYEGWPELSGALMERAVRWSIEAYYGQPELTHVPRFY
jgi:hypothetical protein